MRLTIWGIVTLMIILTSCQNKQSETESEQAPFNVTADRFADIRVLRYQVPGFESLPLQKKKLLYYLSRAALSGRDIIYDQNYRWNLAVRRTLEAMIRNHMGSAENEDYQKFIEYVKRVWFSNGIHHHYSTIKFTPEISKAYFTKLLDAVPENQLPLREGQDREAFTQWILPIIFDPDLDRKRVNLDHGVDHVKESANNYYQGVTQKEVEDFYARKIDKNDPQPISYGLNSRLVKENGVIREKVWKVGGLYGAALEKAVFWLQKARDVAENDKQKKWLDLLIRYYQTGDLKIFDEFSIAWVNDTDSDIDLIHGFIEVYGDALGYRGAYESIVELKDPVASKRIEAISAQAQWFENNSPIMDEHKKSKVKGITANVINAVMEAGDAAPSTPIGVNLPNANWIRATHGSKSINLGNIVNAYDEASKSSGMLEEFAWDEDQIKLEREWGTLGDNLHTDMHEVIGHASGKINPGVGTPKETLKNYSSTLEEARADLVALYFLMDERLVDMGILPNLNPGKAQYNDYIRNGLMLQLRRLKKGENLEEAHMRNRQLVAKWVYEKGKKDNVIEKRVRDGKTFFVINDYMKLRDLFGQLLREIQRIKSEGDYEAGKNLVETYGVKVDPALHDEVVARYAKLDIPPYAGFIQPKLTAVEKNGEIVDVTITYPEDFMEQMLEYAEKYSFLPTYND
ncbi:MAG: dihydrofolate reductase [Calditrichaeota bacterium]|nr:MAG: dihydrofolate reductase [Calditrichota bacterium]